MPDRNLDRDLDRRIAALALPALGSIAAEPAYGLADTAIDGHLGPGAARMRWPSRPPR